MLPLSIAQATDPIVCALMILAFPACAQDSISSQGNCNVNAQGGSGNTYVINCTPDAPEVPKEVLIVLTSDQFGAIAFMMPNGMPFYFPPNMLDIISSSYTIEISDFSADQYFDQPFEIGEAHLTSGKHKFAMRADLEYATGGSAKATCGGIVDLQSSATLYPRFRVLVDPNSGSIASGGCWFQGFPG